jgi:hypothetical protein
MSNTNPLRYHKQLIIRADQEVEEALDMLVRTEKMPPGMRQPSRADIVRKLILTAAHEARHAHG